MGVQKYGIENISLFYFLEIYTSYSDIRIQKYITRSQITNSSLYDLIEKARGNCEFTYLGGGGGGKIGFFVQSQNKWGEKRKENGGFVASPYNIPCVSP